jgi:hypothetical protein
MLSSIYRNFDEEYFQMRLFAQSLTSDVKNLFKELLAANIADIVAFH